MASINLERRAQIGREKRERTRKALVAAARSLFTFRSIDSITVDDVVAGARLAKGTFYSHFKDLNCLTAAVADELVSSFDDLLQPTLLTIVDPLDRIASGCNAFIEKAIEDPVWAHVVTGIARCRRTIGEVTRNRLRENLQQALKDVNGLAPSLELAMEIVTGLMLQALSAFAEKRVSSADREPFLAALLRALGVDDGRIRATLARLPNRR